MNKELEALEEGWREIKAYLDYCFGRRQFCNAMKYNSTSGYLQPFIDIIETALEKLEILEKAFNELIKENEIIEKRLKRINKNSHLLVHLCHINQGV